MYEWKQHKPRFDEDRLRLLYQRKQAKMQWLQDQNQSILDNLKNVRREASFKPGGLDIEWYTPASGLC